MQVERLRRDLLRRPLRERVPLVGARLVHDRLAELTVAAILERAGEEREFHRVSEERPRRLTERDEAEARQIAVAPRAVRPRSDDERLLRLRAQRVHRLRRAQRPVRILAVEPSADEQHGGRDVLEMRRERALLPERIVVRVRHHRIPERELVAEILGVGVLVRPHVEEEAIAVGVVAVHRHRRAVVRHRRLGTRAREAHEEIETLRERERAVVMPVVAEVPVDERRLRTRRLVRRVRVDHSRGREEAGRRDAPGADATVVVRDVLDQPVDRVVGVGAFVDVLCAVLDVDVRRHVLEVALRHEAPARVLVDEDEAVVAEPLRWVRVAPDTGRRRRARRCTVCATS